MFTSWERGAAAKTSSGLKEVYESTTTIVFADVEQTRNDGLEDTEEMSMEV